MTAWLAPDSADKPRIADIPHRPAIVLPGSAALPARGSNASVLIRLHSVAVQTETSFMNGQGSAGNVIAALASFFIPGLGQLLQGRWIRAGIMFVLAAVFWYTIILIPLALLVHLWSIIDAAMFRPPAFHR